MNYIETLLIAVATATASGIITYILQERRLKREFRVRIEAHKTEFMAEQAARHFLNHEGYTDRSFSVLKKNLGGWDSDEDELRRILVRAGAVRSFRDDGSEWWTLIERIPEKIKRLRKQ